MTLTWTREDSPRCDADKQRLFGPAELAAVGLAPPAPEEPVANEWWRVTDGDDVAGYGWLDCEWGDARITFFVAPSFPWRANKTALILAPTGLALDGNGTLYVDDTLTDSVSAIPRALTRTTAVTAMGANLSAGGALNAPLGMTMAPNGDLVVVNGDDGNAVEITPAGQQLATRTLITDGAGDLFGVITNQAGDGLIIGNDGTDALDEISM